MDGLLDGFEGCHADRTAGAVHKLDLRRDQLVNPIAHQRVGLATADFHEHAGPRDTPGKVRDQSAGNARVAIFVKILHKRIQDSGFGIQDSGEPEPEEPES